MTQNDSSHSAYRKGASSFWNNQGKLVNPYKSGTEEYNLFERGYLQALKRRPNEHSKNDFNGSFASEYKVAKEFEPVKPKLSAAQEAVKKAYANRK